MRLSHAAAAVRLDVARFVLSTGAGVCSMQVPAAVLAACSVCVPGCQLQEHLLGVCVVV